MKITHLKIERQHAWEPPSEDNPLRAVVKIDSDRSNIEVVLSEETAVKILDLCTKEVAQETERHMKALRNTLTQIEADKTKEIAG